MTQHRARYKSSADDNKQALFRLSVIVPYRDEGTIDWYPERLREQCASFPQISEIEYIVVDSGSPPAGRLRTEEICKFYGIKYLYHDTIGRIFSIGSARDFGAMHARGSAITFFDIDWRVQVNFWTRLLEFMNQYGINRQKKRFFSIPALYLTKEGTDQYYDNGISVGELYLDWLHGDQRYIQNIAPCSSIIVLDRLYFLSIGGHNPEFKGHGYEDFDLLHRLAAENAEIPRPQSYYSDTKSWDVSTYVGFRAMFALFGRAPLLCGLFVVHLWHERPSKLSFYDRSAMSGNRILLTDLFKEFDSNGEHPEPLIDVDASSMRIGILGRPRTNATRCLRDAMPILGAPLYLDESEFVEEDGSFNPVIFRQKLRALNVEKILFNSPYGNPNRLAIYRWCRENSMPYLVFERGCLPDSWFFDPNGFNADSASYDRSQWDRALSVNEREKTEAYISQCLEGNETLEKQSRRVGAEVLARRLGLAGKKVLFVPLQRPSDTVTVHMAGAIGSCSAFLSLVDNLAYHLRGTEWVVLCKRHPLESESPPLKWASYVPHDTNFLDLVEMAHSIALINSGVGVYAMMMGKPCYIFGHAFYANDGLNMQIEKLDAKTIAKQVIAGHAVDRELALRFISFLLHRFYSFGTAKVVSSIEPDGSLRSRTRSIDFYELRVPNTPTIIWEKPYARKIADWSPLFERYRLYIHNSKTKPIANARLSAGPQSPAQRSLAGPSFSRKLRKLTRSPTMFFLDSKFAPLRLFGMLLKRWPRSEKSERARK